MVLIDKLLQSSDDHRSASDFLDFFIVLVLLLILGLFYRLLSELIFNELLLHEEVVFDPLAPEHSESALGDRDNIWEFGCDVDAFF